MNSRITFIDSLRGLAVAGMLVYHLVFILNFFKVIVFDLHESIEMYVLGNLVRIIFFITAGISSTLIFLNYYPKNKFFNKLWSRFLKVFEAAVIISLASFVFYEDSTVYFGVLHALAFGSLFSGLIIQYRKTSMLLMLSLLTFGFRIGCTDSIFPITYILGFSCTRLQTFDYFPLFPWMGFILLGQLVGESVIKLTKEVKLNKWIEGTFGLIGRNALRVYLLHIPLFIVLVLIYKIVFAK